MYIGSCVGHSLGVAFFIGFILGNPFKLETNKFKTELWLVKQLLRSTIPKYNKKMTTVQIYAKNRSHGYG